MDKLTGQQKTAYFRRSFTAVDGLWFMKLEEKYGFEKALEIDNEVWKVFPKIQARELKTALHLDEGLEALQTCLTADLELKGFTFQAQQNESPRELRIVITDCPWHNGMVKSGRVHLSARVGEVICRTEYFTWAKEFGQNIIFSYQPAKSLCAGGKDCILNFRVRE